MAKKECRQSFVKQMIACTLFLPIFTAAKDEEYFTLDIWIILLQRLCTCNILVCQGLVKILILTKNFYFSMLQNYPYCWIWTIITLISNANLLVLGTNVSENMRNQMSAGNVALFSQGETLQRLEKKVFIISIFRLW